ncbi:MAG: hypothetical protein HEQ29_16355 [Dolichospermum sp. LBC05a]|nr:hypothetical protein [Dolichospermum sp. OL01]MCO5798261.1 hypothetical protein [Dolichospermum sp. OL03]MCS6281857.1 hypothetical protein [Dolichospermum sp.]QSV56967.1 MAG: hypothetical protein HEQ29_16355 [Dolichospermum sp. LBC05a]
MVTIFVDEQELTKQIVQDIGRNEIAIAVKKLRQQAKNSCELPPTAKLSPGACDVKVVYLSVEG